VGRYQSRLPAWTTPDEVSAKLRRRWESGEFLTGLARKTSWEPLAVALRAPTAAELADYFGPAQDWIAQWQAINANLVRLEYKTVGGRLIGTNRVPCRAWIDSQHQLWTLLRVSRQVDTFLGLLDTTHTTAPRLLDWMAAYPMKVLAHESRWASLVNTVVWIDSNARPEMYLRQIDVPGVDTKFVEQHRGILANLLDQQLPAERIDPTRQPSAFAERYRFSTKPVYVRLRALDRTRPILQPYTELTLRVDEFAATRASVDTVYVVENEITYLAFPPVDDAMVIFGEGYALPRLQPVQWLHDRELVYWGDIDTHGFAILDRLRQAFPHTRSMLMDRDTLLAHREHWISEPAPSKAALPHLRPAEAALYGELIADALSPSVRLEQERVRYSAIEEALSAQPTLSTDR
jgi:hypothetical protein